MNDDTSLYVTIDATPDNTMDGDKDYAKVYVKTAAGLRAFKLSVPETRWGEAFFVYTGNVPYQHKVYEFIIPLQELGVSETGRDGKIQMAFSVYGTLSVGEHFSFQTANSGQRRGCGQGRFTGP